MVSDDRYLLRTSNIRVIGWGKSQFQDSPYSVGPILKDLNERIRAYTVTATKAINAYYRIGGSIPITHGTLPDIIAQYFGINIWPSQAPRIECALAAMICQLKGVLMSIPPEDGFLFGKKGICG